MGLLSTKHRHLLETARALKLKSKVPDGLWEDYLLTATFIINRLPFTVLDGQTPFKVLFPKDAEYSFMRVC